jgi:ribA/ribD-fused uncharacterized protein
MAKLVEVKKDYLFFWRTAGKKGCLSQWFDSPFEENGERYYNCEQYMMKQKAKLFGDAEIEAKILKSKSPKTIKALGRKVKGFNEEIWNENKFNIVFRGNLLKFRQNPEMREFLLNTKNKYLVEASPYDKIWGIGLSEKDAKKTPFINWGENLLGKALMEVRKELVKRNLLPQQ